MCAEKRIKYHTLGCKLNYSETSSIARRMEEYGYPRTTQASEAAMIIINSCSVTEHADKKCRNLIRHLHRESPSAPIVVTGCYAQLKPDEIMDIEGVRLVIGNSDKNRLVELCDKILRNDKPDDTAPVLPEMSARADATCVMAASPTLQTVSADTTPTCENDFFAAYSSGDRTRSFLKIQDGCDYRCSYCTIPLARGASRNIPIAEVVGSARRIAADGCREIVITGINTGDFGRTTGESFHELLAQLDKVSGIDRYRISSIEPNLLTDRIIALCAESEKFQPHFHVPLQSGSDRILGLMRRRYNSTLFRNRIEAVRKALPDSFIGVDVIVGFPAETDEDFECTMRLLEELNVSFIHVFPFSARRGTPAAEMDGKVKDAIKTERAQRLNELSHKLHMNFCGRHVGSVSEVLFEGKRQSGMMFGYTGNYIRCQSEYNPAAVNKIIRVRLEKLENDGSVRASIL